MPSKKRFLKWFLGILIVVLMIIPTVMTQMAPKEKLEIIRSVKVTRGNIQATITATGEVKPQNRVEIKPPIAGRLEQVLVKEGDQVKQGQVLAWMSSTDRAALLDAARAKGPEVYQEWEAAYRPAPLISPLDGTVIVQTIQPGQTIAIADPVVVISDRLIVKAMVDETDLAQITLDQKATLALDAYPGKTISAKVDHIKHESTLVNNVNVYSVDVVPDEASPLLRSGMTAAVTFIVTDRQNVLQMPLDAVTSWPRNIPNPQKAEFAVYKKMFGGKLVPVPVRLGESDNQMTEVLEGVGEGEEIQVIHKKRSSAKSPFLQQGGQRQQQQRRN